MTARERQLADDYDLVSGGLVDALDAVNTAYTHLMKGEHGAALAALVALRERMGFRVPG